MPPTELSLDAPQLLRQLRELGAIGQRPGDEGRTRIALSDDDRAGRDQLVRWMHDLELDVRIDQIGNVLGILHPDRGGLPQRPLMIGSHIDTVRNAGALDGCYGVLAGLAVARAYRQAGVSPTRGIVVAAFTNEEGVRFQPDMMGSLVYAGGMCVQAAHDTVDGDGERLGDELARIGYAGDMVPGSLVPHEYLELHIEQGPLLEARDLMPAAALGAGIAGHDIECGAQFPSSGYRRVLPMTRRHGLKPRLPQACRFRSRPPRRAGRPATGRSGRSG